MTIREEGPVTKTDQAIFELPIICMEEDEVVGVLPIVAGQPIRISSHELWAKFKPVTQERRLPFARQKDGEYLRCPRCQGNLGIVGDLKIKDPLKAVGSMGGVAAGSPEARDLARKVRDQKDATIPIVLGNTVVRGG